MVADRHYARCLLVVQCWMAWRIQGQNIVRHPRLPVELGQTAELREVSLNYYVIKHRDARTPEETPRTGETDKRSQIYAREQELQQKQLRSHYKLRELGLTNASAEGPEYHFHPPSEYHVGLLVNPCMGKRHDCCMRKYGMPEYRVDKDKLSDPKRVVGGTGVSSEHSVLKDEFNVTLDNTVSRLADDGVRLNETCLGDREPFANCVGDVRQSAKPDLRSRQERVPFGQLPDCWDHNNTVDAGRNCTAPDGTVHPTCMAVGYSQSALIFVCGGRFANDPGCGTFLEVHLTPTSTWQAKGVHVYEHVAIVPVQCPGFRCAEVFTPGTRFEIRETSHPDGHVLFGPATVERAVEKNAEGKPCDRRKHDAGTDMCTQTWIYWKEKSLTGPGYHACSLLYNDDLIRYGDMRHPVPDAVDTFGALTDHQRPRRCSILPGEETIEPLFIRGDHNPEASIFTIGGDTEVLAETKLSKTQVDGYETTTISTLYKAKEQAALEGQLRGLWNTKASASAPVDIFAQGESLPNTKYGARDLDKRRILCARDYELWWVQRTPARHVVLKRKGFRVQSPRCKFDLVNERYLPYTTMSEVSTTVEEEHIVTDLFSNNHRQWYRPGDERRKINADGIPQYDPTPNRTWSQGSKWWNKGMNSPQHASHKNDFFFDH